MLDKPGNIPILRDQGNVYYADTCEPLRVAVANEQVHMHALARENYPGDPIPESAPEEVRTVGFWDAARKQNWGLDWHRNEGLEITFLARGTVAFATEQNEHLLNRGHMTITRPWQSHRVGLPTVNPSRLHWLILDLGVRRPSQKWVWPDWVMLAPEDLKLLTKLLQLNENPVWFAGDSIGEIFEALSECTLDPNRPGFASELRLRINELLLELLRVLLSLEVSCDEELVSTERNVRLFLEDIKLRIAEEWSLESMAEEAGLGRTQFSRHCQSLTNMTPIQYLTHCRVLAAGALLKERSDLSVTEIAFACGFGSSQYFSSQFRRYFQVTPSLYRERESDS